MSHVPASTSRIATSWRCVLSVVLLAIAACESPNGLQPETSEQRFSLAPGQQAQEDVLVRIVAAALRNPVVRQQVYEDMRNSEVAEGKLHLATYLSGRGGVIAAVAPDFDVRTPNQARAFMAGLPSIELYMPVPEHRRQWTGGEDLVVFAWIGDVGAPAAVTLDGDPFPISLAEPPDRPVLVLTESESFSPRGSALPGRTKGSGLVVEQHGVRTMDACDPETSIEPCPGEGGGGGGWSAPSDAVWQRGVGVREYATHFRTPNDHEPWHRGAPEFVLFIVGTSNTSDTAELANKLFIPESTWAGSDDTKNAKWRRVGGGSLALADWDTDYGNRVKIKCMEQDGGSQTNLTINGETTIGGVGIDFSHTFQLNDGSDECGEFARLIRTSTGAWTSIPNAETLFRAAPDEYDEVSHLNWSGYGRSLVP